ncbi:hypothetical protein C0Q88_22700 [Ralstonia pickettii]|uniref:Alginate export domain-containing protein n=1 Tax=Ralstonia pickettii TaxID=329 RepID=A0A2N4TLL5_RALPI|nr:alginate export family protein [Ralstonia pickettii]PLC40607.1 hypothetical protein C0Q88_22700 [Ralstonia pickettii]
MRQAVICVFLLTIGVAASAREGPISTSPFRYDDDPTAFSKAGSEDLYGKLKFTPLSKESYLSFGADLRERFESNNVGLLGFRTATDDTYWLHRLLIHTDLHIDSNLRAFFQLGNHNEIGRRPKAAPTDVDRLDVQQGFLDFSRNAGPGQVTLRAGRAEMSYDDGALIGLRDGPNVRQVWDGVRASYVEEKWRWDAFAVRPVQVEAGVFDDRTLPGQKLSGVHVTGSPLGMESLAVDAFYYHNVNPQVNFLAATEEETTDTLGARVRGVSGRMDFSLGGTSQHGRFGDRRVRAFSAHADAGLTLPAPWAPHIQLRGDILSGGDSAGGTVKTFNALYPNVAYSTEATIEAPANLVEAGIVVKAHPKETLTLQYTVESLWRYSTKDAFYTAPLFPMIKPDGIGGRFSGIEQQATISYRFNNFMTINFALVHFGVGTFIRRAGGVDENFGMISIGLRI